LSTPNQDSIECHEPTHHSHAAERWATVVVLIVSSPADPKTLEAWARHVGASPGALRVWCRAARVRPKAALDCGRLLRAVVLARATGKWDPQNLLDVIDHRTLTALLDRGGLPHEVSSSEIPSLESYLRNQALVTDPVNLGAVRGRVSFNRSRGHLLRGGYDVQHGQERWTPRAASVQ